jgi:hypothetical protein
VLNRTLCKGLCLDLWEIPEKRLNIILSLKRANSIHDRGLLVMLPLTKAAYIKRLN